LFVVPDISQAVHDIEHDDQLSAREKIERRRTVETEYAQKNEILHIIHKLLQAHVLYEKDVDYVVQEGQVFIVDEFTGRLMPGRRWSDGLHQARSEEHTSELQSRVDLVCRLLLEKKKRTT